MFSAKMNGRSLDVSFIRYIHIHLGMTYIKPDEDAYVRHLNEWAF